MQEFIDPLIIEGRNKMIENIKILLYKENEHIFDYINFEDDNIYQEPLLYAYFNSHEKENIDLKTILYGYMKYELQPNEIEVPSDNYGRIYMANIGWFLTDKPNELICLKKNTTKYELYIKTKKINFVFESLDFVKGTNIEFLKYPIPLLDQCYYDVDKNLIEVEIENISQFQRKNLTEAFKLIKKYVPNQYKLISLVVKKSVIFNVDSGLRNSFATMKSHGISFFNSYQNNYNEVFFVDDIAHQTGHCIFYTLLEDVKEFIKVDPSKVIETISYGESETETRDFYTLFHALYTYYTTLLCLDACLNANVFNDIKKHEALGRLCFYFSKCYKDILLIDNPINSSTRSKEMFTDKGFKIYFEIKNTFIKLADKWREDIKKGYSLSNQPYNFTYSNFVELNPLNENNY